MDSLKIKTVGWTLGNDCPYRCPQCYSAIVRNGGRYLTKQDVDIIINQIKSIDVKAVNLGGNEPIFTNGMSTQDTLLPYIIRSLYNAGITIGLTTAGISMVCLERFYPETLTFLGDVDISLDSPFADEHNINRGAQLYNQALKALAICNDYDIPRSIVMCGMNWNLSDCHIDKLIEISKEYKAFVRINFMKPIEPKHMEKLPDAHAYFSATQKLLSCCDLVEAGEPPISAAIGSTGNGCPCGTRSFRIHSITRDGKIPVSPCVYAHDYKVGDILKDSLNDIINSAQFQLFRNRLENPQNIPGCSDCRHIELCRGGCAARAYLVHKLKSGDLNLMVRDPYCIKEVEPFNKEDSSLVGSIKVQQSNTTLVHQNYLCTLIFRPK